MDRERNIVNQAGACSTKTWTGGARRSREKRFAFQVGQEKAQLRGALAKREALR